MTKARTLADNFAADINGITAGTGITGGGTSGTVTITNEMATTITAKGDLLAGTGNAAFDNLAAGASGETLVADSSTSTGLRYNPQNALANPVINGGMDIFQRGTSSTAIGSGTFLADRWQAARVGFAAGGSQSRQTVSDSTNLPNIQYSLRIQRDSGNTSTAAVIVGQNIESVNSIPFAGKTITLSFYARKGADFSAASSVLTTDVASGTGTDQNLVTSGTLTGIDNTATNHTLTTTWQRFTVTKAVASTATQLAFQFFYTPVGTAGAADYFEVTGVQIDLGTYTKDTAPTFRRSGGNIAGELQACQRYYEQFEGDQGNSVLCINQAISTTDTLGTYYYKVSKRVAPTIAISGGTSGAFNASASVVNGTVGFQDINTFFTRVTVTGASGLVAGNASGVYLSYAKVTISAEL